MNLCVLAVTFWCFRLCCSSSNCPVSAFLTRNIDKDGFHRYLKSNKFLEDLHSYVEISAKDLSLFANCTVIEKQTIPSGAYVNPDEVADMRRLGQVSVCVRGDVDIEAPKEVSYPYEIFIYHSMQQTQNKLIGSSVLPFHLRYHNPLPKGGEEEVILELPTLLFYCSPDLPCLSKCTEIAPCVPCGHDKCHCHNVSYATDSKRLYLRVPVGSTDHYATVLVCTLLATFGGSAYLISLLIYHHWK